MSTVLKYSATTVCADVDDGDGGGGRDYRLDRDAETAPAATTPVALSNAATEFMRSVSLSSTFEGDILQDRAGRMRAAFVKTSSVETRPHRSSTRARSCRWALTAPHRCGTPSAQGAAGVTLVYIA